MLIKLFQFSRNKFLALGFLIEALLLYYTFSNLALPCIFLYMIIYSLVFLLFLFAAQLVKRREKKTISLFDKEFSLAYVIILFGLLFRLTLVPSSPTTSDDYYRYLWEGKVLLHGINPYEKNPADTSLIYLHGKDLPSKVSFKTMTAIYPPVAQLIFAASYFISGESPVGLKLIYLICEFFTLLFLLKLFRLQKENEHQIIFYAWLPLPIMEFFVNAHLDAAAVMFFVMFLYFVMKNNVIGSSLSFGLSFLIKLYPVFLLPLLLKKFRFKKAVLFYSLFLLIVVVFYFPFLPQDRPLTSSIFKYLSHWEFNGSVYQFVNMFLNNGQTTRLICTACLVVAVAVISFSYKNFLYGVYAVLLAMIIFTPTFYPWYMGWIAAINPLVQFTSVLSLFFTTNLTNVTPMGKVWQEYTWVLLLEYVSFFMLLGYDLYRLKFKKFNGKGN